jgi:hypothetical protein
LEFAIIMAVFFIAGGAPAPHVNETHYLLKAKHYWDPSFCPGDAFLDSADAHVPFYWTVGWLTKFVSLEATAWIGRIAAWILIALGWMQLTRAITRVPWTAALTALVWIVLVDKCEFAGEWVVGGLRGKGGVEGKCFAYAFVLFGLASLAAGRWRTMWIWFGAGAAMHVLVGAWAVLAGLGAWLTEPRNTRPTFASLLPGLALGGLLSLAGLLPALAMDRNATPAQTDEAAQIYVFQRLPHHLAPASLPAEEFARRSIRFGALVIAFAALAIALNNSTGQTATRSGLGPRGGPASWEDYSNPAIARIMRFAAMALVGNCVGLSIELLLSDHPVAAARLLRYYWFRQADVIVPAAVALAAACVAMDLQRREKPWAKLVAALAVLLCTSHLAWIALVRYRNPAPPAAERMENVVAWLNACAWIREHAPPNALCLTPRQSQSFKWFAERADVVNWKDVPQDAVGVIEWRRRLQDVFPTVDTDEGPKVLGSPEQWSEARVREIAQRYGASYVIARSDPPLALRQVFVSGDGNEGGGYAIYELDADDDRNAANEGGGSDAL